MTKIISLEELEKTLINDHKAVISSIDEINSYEEYSLVGDSEHDYSCLYRVYKINYENINNPYNVIFLIVFGKNGRIFDVMGLGEESKELSNIWSKIDWEEK